MDAKFERRLLSFGNSLDALAEARQRDLSDSFVLSGTMQSWERILICFMTFGSV